MKWFLTIQKIPPFSKASFPIFVQNLVSKLPPSPNVFTKSNVTSYYDGIKFKDLNFEFSETSEKILNILKGLTHMMVLSLRT